MSASARPRSTRVSKRRWIIATTLLLLGGMAVNVGVAWGCVATASQIGTVRQAAQMRSHSTDGQGFVHFAQLSNDLVWQGLFVRYEVDLDALLADDLLMNDWPGPIPASTILRIVPESSNVSLLHASGWPLRALWRNTGQSIFRRDTSRRNPSGPNWVMFPWPRNELSAYPYRPLWPGFLINTFFYALVLALPWLGFVQMRRFRRARAGRCRACGYDLSATPSGLPCSECGHGRAEPMLPNDRT